MTWEKNRYFGAYVAEMSRTCFVSLFTHCKLIYLVRMEFSTARQTLQTLQTFFFFLSDIIHCISV